MGRKVQKVDRAPEAFEGLGELERELVTSHLGTARFRSQRVVFERGEVGHCMYIVRSGRVVVEASTPAGLTVAIRVVHPGECFGELALLRTGHRRSNRVVALEDTETQTLDRRAFETLRAERPTVERLLVTALAEEVVRVSELVAEMLMPAEDRLWRRLTILDEAYGGTIRMTQDHLAHATGAARQTINRTLREAEHDGVLELARGRVIIRNRAALHRLAGH